MTATSEVVIDASVAIKWIAPEALSDQAISLLQGPRLTAPDLLVAECANILWKKVTRGEMAHDLAIVAAQAIEHVEIELVPMRQLLSASLKLAVQLAHPAYDCLYLALALSRKSVLITADERLVDKIAERGDRDLRGRVISLRAADSAVRANP